MKIVIIILILATLGYSISLSLNNKTVAKIVADAIDNLSHIEFYQALANPAVKYVKITEGMRKEEISGMLDGKFGWDDKDRGDFASYDEYRERKFEGKYFPGVYLVPREASGQEVKKMMNNRFRDKIGNAIASSTTKFSTDEVLTIASIIQREAAGANDMRLVSGVIANRLKRGMSLQMDATLQYIKGSEEEWWPIVEPVDKKLRSPYNTYQNKGLPPSPIANPGLAAIRAALNPEATSCLYYFHKNKIIYCSTTYAEHKRKIDLYLK